MCVGWRGRGGGKGRREGERGLKGRSESREGGKGENKERMKDRIRRDRRYEYV